MWRLCLVTLAAHLVLQQTESDPGDTFLTLPQRDALRSRHDPSPASVSADGRYVAFMSYARLVTGDTNDRADIYLLDRHTGQVTLETIDGRGTPLHGTCAFPRLSGDGRRLTFDAAVYTDDGMPTVQVVLRDRVARTTTWIGQTADRRFPNGWSREPSLSADGSVVVFSSAATDLVTGVDANGVGPDIYAYVAASGTLERISVDTQGRQPASGHSYAPSVSADGRHVAFVSTADLGGVGGARQDLPPSRRPFGHIYVRDRQTGVTTRISESRTGHPANDGSWDPAMSGDGRFVAFASAASNLVENDRNRTADVFLHDRASGTTVLVSRNGRGAAANGASTNPEVSTDGRFVAFQSEASDLVCSRRCNAQDEDINLVHDVFVFDRTTGRTRRVSSGAWMEESGGPALSADGRVIVFTSRHPIAPDDESSDFDLFVAGEQEIRR